MPGNSLISSLRYKDKNDCCCCIFCTRTAASGSSGSDAVVAVHVWQEGTVPGKRPDHIIVPHTAFYGCVQRPSELPPTETLLLLSVYTYCPAFLRIDCSVTKFKHLLYRKMLLYVRIIYIRCVVLIVTYSGVYTVDYKHTWKVPANTAPSHYLYLHRDWSLFLRASPPCTKKGQG